MPTFLSRPLTALLICAGLGSAGPAAATADGPDRYAVTGVSAGSVLNLRAAPGPDSTIIGTIPHDATGLANLGCVGGLTYAEWAEATEAERAAATRTRWCRVGYDRKIGWSAGWFLTEGAGEDQFRAGGRLSDLAGAEWLLRDFAGTPVAQEAWIAFGAEGAVSGNSGCNSFTGQRAPETEAEAFRPLASTRRLCPEAEMQTELAFLEVLGQTREIVAHSLVMAFFGPGDTLLATFTRRDAD